MKNFPTDFGEFGDPFVPETAKLLDNWYAQANGEERVLRDEFIVPNIGDLKRKTIAPDEATDPKDSTPSIYLCGNSLGLQPKRTRAFIDKYLNTWASKGVHGHFTELSDAETAPWLHLDDQVKVGMAKIVGAQPAEVAVMETLTVNLHLLMASFYRPTKEKYKIVIEGKAFPSDHYAVQSHLAHHNLSAADALVVIAPSDVDRHYFSTRHICDTIAAHAADTALVLLPGIHYYTGQLFDIKTITAFAHSLNIPIGWDLAHAAGNVPLHLHDWDVDFAAWCTYKYLNAGPGAIGALFVHERHGKVTRTDPSPPPLSNGVDPTNLTVTAADDDNDHATYTYTPRLSGWWGSSKTSRFAMRNVFLPIPGASGWQLSNPSALDVTSVLASLSVHEATSMAALRARSRRLTAYLELLLERWPPGTAPRPYVLLTPREAEERGAQISIRLRPGMLERVLAALEADGVVVDERKPDVIRVAPAPLYNTFLDVWRFVESLWRALEGVGLEDGQKGG